MTPLPDFLRPTSWPPSYRGNCDEWNGRIHGSLPAQIEADFSQPRPAFAPEERLTVATLVNDAAIYARHLQRTLDRQDLRFELWIEENHDNHTRLAEFFNRVVERARHDRILFVHPDVEFSPWGLRRLLETMDQHADCGAAGFVGKSLNGFFCFSGSLNEFTPVSTLDSCSLLIDRRQGLRFDARRFDGFHCAVEDYCCQVQHRGMQVLVSPRVSFGHWSSTCLDPAQGAAWIADHFRYFRLLEDKWCGVPFATTGGGLDRRSAVVRDLYLTQGIQLDRYRKQCEQLEQHLKHSEQLSGPLRERLTALECEPWSRLISRCQAATVRRCRTLVRTYLPWSIGPLRTLARLLRWAAPPRVPEPNPANPTISTRGTANYAPRG